MSKELDQAIANLKYNEEEVLAFKGESIQNFKKAEGKANDNKYIVIEREKVSMSDKNVDIGIIDSIADLTYPGALVKVNSKLVENMPQPITLARKPMRFVIDLPGLEDERIFTVDAPDYGSVTSGIAKKFALWNEKCSKKFSIVARSYYTESMVYSESQLLAKFGFGIKQAEKSLNIDFSAICNSKSSVFISSFRQIFYTVSLASQPQYPSDSFNDNVTWSDLERFGVNNDNPPAMIYKVAYGRTIYIKMESNSTSNEVEAAFKAAINDVDVSSNLKYKNILENSSFTAVILGGGMEAHNEVLNIKDYSKIKEVIAKYSSCSASNPGYPVSYSTAFLKDNKLAAINSSTEYIKTTTTEYQNAEIELIHNGGYVAQFKVTWNEITFDSEGNKKIEAKGWDGNLQDRTASFSTTITIQGNSENLCVFAKECTGLAWEWWRTVFDKKNIALVSKRTFNIYGTTLNQQYKITPEC